MLAILLGFCWQVSVGQSHIHVLPVVSGTSADNPNADASVGRTPARPDTPLSCPICRELIHAGHFLPGAPPVLPPFVRGLPFPAPLFAGFIGTGRQRSHFWYGRAPPASIPVP